MEKTQKCVEGEERMLKGTELESAGGNVIGESSDCFLLGKKKDFFFLLLFEYCWNCIVS